MKWKVKHKTFFSFLTSSAWEISSFYLAESTRYNDFIIVNPYPPRFATLHTPSYWHISNCCLSIQVSLAMTTEFFFTFFCCFFFWNSQMYILSLFWMTVPSSLFFFIEKNHNWELSESEERVVPLKQLFTLVSNETGPTNKK
jgi:hypothetical protein